MAEEGRKKENTGKMNAEIWVASWFTFEGILEKRGKKNPENLSPPNDSIVIAAVWLFLIKEEFPHCRIALSRSIFLSWWQMSSYTFDFVFSCVEVGVILLLLPQVKKKL